MIKSLPLSPEEMAARVAEYTATLRAQMSQLEAAVDRTEKINILEDTFEKRRELITSLGGFAAGGDFLAVLTPLLEDGLV